MGKKVSGLHPEKGGAALHNIAKTITIHQSDFCTKTTRKMINNAKYEQILVIKFKKWEDVGTVRKMRKNVQF